MKISHRKPLTESAPVARLARLLEEQLSDTEARSDVPNAASPACTNLNVALRSSRATSEEAYATERLALTTRVPTLVVQDPARIPAWLRGHRALRVLCAHDLTSVADEALRLVPQFGEIGRCEITLAHVHRSVEQVSHPDEGRALAANRSTRARLIEGSMTKPSTNFMPMKLHVTPHHLTLSEALNGFTARKISALGDITRDIDAAHVVLAA